MIIVTAGFADRIFPNFTILLAIPVYCATVYLASWKIYMGTSCQNENGARDTE